VSIQADSAEFIEREQRALAGVRRAVRRLADEVADYPQMWRWGDGDGGAILDMIRARLDELGVDVRAPERAPGRKTIGQARRMRIFERDGFQCKRCGVQKDLTVDHIWPVSRGGSDDDDNLQTLCRRCNTSKGAKVTYDRADG
jgi:hypothetical protein